MTDRAGRDGTTGRTGATGRAATSRAAVDAALAAVQAHDHRVGAFTRLLADRARAEAAERDAAPSATAAPAGEPGATGEPGALHGLPVAVKEIVDVEGGDGCYGSPVLAGRVAERDALLVARLRAAGAVPVGQTRSHEFAWGITTQQAERGSTRNPWDTDRVPGGSSGGSAAAVAAGMVRLAVGSDTGGSIRIPAAWCGVFGLKTTWGRVGRTGMVALAPSFDTPGYLADSAALLHAALAATAGPDPDDPATAGAPPYPDRPLLPDPVAGLRFAVPAGLGPEVPDADRRAALDRVTGALARLGGRPVEVAVTGCADLYPVFAPFQMYEAYRVHTEDLGTYPRLADRYGADVRHRLELAAGVTAADHRQARAAAAAARDTLLAALAGAEVLVTLVGSTGPSTVGDPDHATTRTGERVTLRQAVMPSTVPQNLAGLPSVTVPAGLDDDGLPVGVQLTGAPWSEHLLLSVAAALQAAGAAEFRVAPGFG